MTWGLFVLILVLAIAFIVLCYLNIENFSYFMENYFIFILLIIFVILLFVVDFNNQIQITTYVKVKNDFSATPLIYQVPYHSDSDITNTVNVAFAGTCEALGGTPALQSVTNTQINFNIDDLAVGGSVTLYANNLGVTPLFVITKTNNYTLSVTNTAQSVNGGKMLDGYLTLTLLCTGSQSIESYFKRLD